MSVPSAVVAILASANESAAMLASDLQRAAWSAEDLGAAEAAAFIERQEMALTAIRDELRKLTGARS